jgi:hypothetical protein
LLKPNTLPRMADFAKWAMACEEPLGFKPGDFMRAYDKNRNESSLAVLEGSPAILELAKMMAMRSSWEGTHQDLLAQLKSMASADVRRDPRWPHSAKALSSAIARANTDLEVAKVQVERPRREPRTGRRIIRLSRIP